MECKKCGAQISDEVTVCPSCGYDLNEEITEETVEAVEIAEDEITEEFGEISDKDEKILDFVIEDEEGDFEEDDEEEIGGCVDFFAEEPVKQSKTKKVIALILSAVLLVAATVGVCAIVFKKVYSENVIYITPGELTAEGNETWYGSKVSVAEFDGCDITMEEYKIFFGSVYNAYAKSVPEEQWDADVNGKTFYQDMKDSIFNSVVEFYIVAKDARDKGVVPSEDAIAQAEGGILGNSGLTKEELVKVCGSTVEAYDKAIENFALYIEHQQDFVSDVNTEFSDEEINGKINEMFMCAKHILFSTMDEERNPVSEEEKAAKKAKAEEILSKINNDNFDELMKENSEDPGMETSPNGMLFTDGQMVPEFENAVKALSENQISGIVESDYGYHIILRLPVEVTPESEEYAYASSVVQSALYTDAVAEKIDGLKSEWGFKEHKEEVDNIKRY